MRRTALVAARVRRMSRFLTPHPDEDRRRAVLIYTYTASRLRSWTGFRQKMASRADKANLRRLMADEAGEKRGGEKDRVDKTCGCSHGQSTSRLERSSWAAQGLNGSARSPQ